MSVIPILGQYWGNSSIRGNPEGHCLASFVELVCFRFGERLCLSQKINVGNDCHLMSISVLHTHTHTKESINTTKCTASRSGLVAYTFNPSPLETRVRLHHETVSNSNNHNSKAKYGSHNLTQAHSHVPNTPTSLQETFPLAPKCTSWWVSPSYLQTHRHKQRHRHVYVYNSIQT